MKAAIILAITLSLFSGLSLASTENRKTDVVTLYNGDKITGEIKHLAGGLLDLKTNALGTVKIEWQEIATIESLYHYEVRLSEGKRYYGKIDLSPRPGEILVSDVYGEHDISSLEVVEIRPISKTFKDQIDIYLSLGLSYNNSAATSQGSFNTDISYENERARNALTGRVLLSRTNIDDTAIQTHSSKFDVTRSVWTNREDVYRLLTSAYETNDELGLDHRLSVGAGLGKHFKDTHSSSWEGSTGLQVLTEKTTLGEEQDSVEAFIQSSFSTWRYQTPELHVKLSGGLYPSITEAGRYRGDADFTLRWEIVEDLFWDVTAFGTYDNKAAEDSRFDYGVTTGVGWTY